MAVIQLRETTLADEIYKVATQEGKSADDVLADAARQYLAAYRQKRIKADTDAWYRMPAEIRQQYKGQFVAIYQGKIVDTDLDRMTLYFRIRERFGREPVVILEGGDQPMPVYYVHSVRQA